MKLVIDYRESALLEKCQLYRFPHVDVSTANLTLGDLALVDELGSEMVLFERKSLSDLLASIKDGRYEEQSYRLIHSSGMHPHNIVYVVEGMFSQLRDDRDRKMVFSAMTSLQYFKGFSVVRTCSVGETAELVMMMADKIHRDRLKGKIGAFPNTAAATAQAEGGDDGVLGPDGDLAVPPSPPSPHYSSVVKKVKKENVTPENIGEIFLCQIPGISSTIAVEIMKLFDGNFLKMMRAIQETPEVLDTIYLETNGKKRKLGKGVITNLKLFMVDK